MNVPRPGACRDFDAAADEVAVGGLDEPARSALLRHAATCSRCGPLLQDLSEVADRLLLLAPETEPPTGFETRAVGRMVAGGETAPAMLASAPAGPPRPRRPGPRPRAMAALAVAAAVGLAGGMLFLPRPGRPRATPALVARQAAIVTASGTRVGTVALVSSPQPHVLVSLTDPRPGAGRLVCQLRAAGGAWVSVGSWTYDDIETGVWAVGVGPSMLQAVAMRVLGAGGDVIATARLD